MKKPLILLALVLLAGPVLADGRAGGASGSGGGGAPSQWSNSGTDIYYNSGNVGVGTTSPGALFDVGAGTLTVTSLGNVGIGTLSPGQKLHIRGITQMNAATAGDAFIDGYNSSGGNVLDLGTDGGGNADLSLYTSGAAKNVQINTSGVSYLNGGNVGISTGAPQALLDVNGTQIFRATTTATAFIMNAASTQTVAAGDTIVANQCGGIKRITAGGAVTTNTTNTFTQLTSETQCIMQVCNVGGTNTITLDQNALFKATGGANLAVAANTCVWVGFDGGVWRQISAVLTAT
jgi:hypothetical protein